MDYAAFELDPTDIEKCLTFIAAELEPFGLGVPSDTKFRLTLEAGKDGDDVLHYRPYGRLAAILSRAINTTHVNVGAGAASSATFRDADKTIATWREEQRELDRLMGFTSAPTTRRTGSRSIRVRAGF